MIDETLDINEFFNRVRGDVSPNIVESTNEKLVTTYLLGIGPIKNVTFQTTISKSEHYIQISAVAETLCAVSN